MFSDLLIRRKSTLEYTTLISAADHGRRGANQHQRPGQKPEKDGLLGSGSFPRASGFQGWNSGSKDREEGPHQLQKSSEPYQPPRPFKV